MHTVRMVLTASRLSEILLSIEEEKRVTHGLTWKEFLLPANRKRVALAVSLQIGRCRQRLGQEPG